MNAEQNLDLDEYLDTVDDTDAPAGATDRQHFEILDDGAAAWAMRKLRRLRRQLATNDEIAAAEIERVAEWRTKANRPLEDSATYFEAILGHYAERCRNNPEDGRKTITLPGGKVSTRYPAPKWDVDSAEFIPWARENAPEFVRVKEEPNLSAMKAAVTGLELSADPDSGIVITTTEGEILPGVTVADSPLSVSISIDLD